MGGFNFGVTAAQRLSSSIVRWEQQKRELMELLRVCLPAIVIAFDAETQTVDVVPATNEYAWFNVPPAGTPSSPPLSIQTQAQQTKQLTGIPIHMQRAGGLCLTFPIVPGDECMVIFGDTAMEMWRQNGNLNNNPLSQRRHSLSDGIAIFGIWSTPRNLTDYSTDSAQLRTEDGETVIDVKAGQVTATADNVVIDGDAQIGTGGDTIKFNTSSTMPTAGWGTPVGGVLIPSFAASGATLPECAEMIAEIVTVLKSVGIFAS